MADDLEGTIIAVCVMIQGTQDIGGSLGEAWNPSEIVSTFLVSQSCSMHNKLAIQTLQTLTNGKVVIRTGGHFAPLSRTEIGISVYPKHPCDTT